MVTRKPALVPGDRVLIQWGLDTAEAEVEQVYQAGIGVQVVVRVPVLGPSGEELAHTTVTVPLTEVRPLSA